MCAVFGHPGGGRRQQLDQFLGGLPRLVACAHLQVAAGQQEKAEHAHRIKIDLAAALHRVPDAGRESAADRQRDRHLHAQLGALEIAPGGGEKAACRVDDHRDGQQEADPAHELLDVHVHAGVVAGIHGDRQHHHLHGAQAGDEQLAQGLRLFLFLHLLLAAGIEGVGDVADRADRLEDVGQLQALLIPGDVRAMGAVVHLKIGHALKRAHMPFVEPHASRAGDAFKDQRGALEVLAGTGDKALLQRRLVVQLHARELFGDQLFGAAGGGFAMLVERGQTAIDNRLRHRLAAMTAHIVLGAVDGDGILGSRRHRQAAMKAAVLRLGIGRRAVAQRGSPSAPSTEVSARISWCASPWRTLSTTRHNPARGIARSTWYLPA